MAAVSRFGSKSGSSPRSIGGSVKTADETLSDKIKTQVSQLVVQLVGNELMELDNKIDKYIKSKNVLVAAPNVVDFAGKRLTNIKGPINQNDAVTLGSLPYNKVDKSWILHFGSHRLQSTAVPSTPQDFVTVAYANSHYEPKKKIGGRAS